MARNSSGTYTLPAGNPVVSSTTISTTWANTTLGDISTELSDSASRSGKGGFSAPVRTADGTVAAPAHAFTSEPASGLYKAGTGDVRFAIGGVDFISKNGVAFPVVGATVSVTGANGILFLAGNKNAADASVDVSAHSTAVRTAGYIFAVQNGDPNVLGSGADRLFVDYHGLLSLAPAAAAAAIQPTALWTAITPNAGWSAANGLAYWKDSNGIVHLKGYVTGAATNPAFTLPIGFRPAAVRFFRSSNGGTTEVNISVGATGDVTCLTGAGVSSSAYVDPISFLAEQ